MNKKTIFVLKVLLINILIFSLMTGCSPAATEQPPPPPPTNTSPPPTPEPTDTPTPMPYNLSVKVSDAEGEPVASAVVILGEQELSTDPDGIAIFQDLPTASVALSVSASGYFSTDVTQEIERGDNQLDVTLERNPVGLPVSEACAAGETLLYIDDFQDGEAQGWDAISMGTQGWSIESDPDRPENTVIAARSGATWAQLGEHTDYPFDNAVWRLRLKSSSDMHINWRFNPSEGDRRYIIGVDPENNVWLRRFDSGQDINLGEVGRLGEGWHFLEISYYDGTVAVYLDGQEGYTWTEPEPWGPGTIGLEPSPKGDAVIYFDNLVVCELNAPFEPLPLPETGYHLQLTVTDADGVPVSGASAAVLELGEMSGAVQLTDDAGQVSWRNLPGETTSLQVSSPGYFAVEETLTIAMDDNQHSVILERDPLSLLASEACRPEETLLYIEDFQDGEAQGWQVIEFRAQGWSIESDPEQPDNLVIAARSGAPWAQLGEGTEYLFTNAVWRVLLNYTRSGNSHLNWRFTSSAGDIRYIIGSDPGGTFHLRRFDSGQDIDLGVVGVPGRGWHLFEISFFDGEVTVYLDGKQGITWTDPEPWDSGTIALEPYPEGDTVMFYDNLVVCELNGPMQTIVVPSE